jgi:hypothetical protein
MKGDHPLIIERSPTTSTSWKLLKHNIYRTVLRLKKPKINENLMFRVAVNHSVGAKVVNVTN